MCMDALETPLFLSAKAKASDWENHYMFNFFRDLQEMQLPHAESNGMAVNADYCQRVSLIFLKTCDKITIYFCY